MHEPRVTILLATYNGERYLAEQLDSIVQQTHKNWNIIASDDGSSDQTMQILDQYNIPVCYGPHQGFAANFLSLITKVSTASDYYAFSDQDDVWEQYKLEQALAWLQSIPEAVPALYCGRTQLVDEYLNVIGYSPLFKRQPGFLNALAQNIGGGNTMMFNRAALNLLRQTKSHTDIVSHDWWAYLLISGAGGAVYYDTEPSIRYRQHATNLVGSNTNLFARCYRVRMLLQRRFKHWLDLNCKSLFAVAHLLTPENKQLLEQFEKARKGWFFSKCIQIKLLGIYRQTTIGQIGLLIGALLNKI
ncbi:glycosyltransferase family 2 protein [Legionella drancourtii]|uniref:Glycosyl transferase family protein n=1 Tax=Legionella drancourtii LLAP12 TaxID=658187 RepID=G9ETU7_9GAMM|nr:glycosyltransferase family 2 protein [Legionella drancourtii]EHL29298.1 glycosyl transferase family protein [Legionella drancourtii LLAP12]